MKLIIFDLDNTLIAGDSDYLWGTFMVDKGIVDPQVYTRENKRFYEAYQHQQLNIFEYQKFVLTPLKSFTQQELTHLHEEFIRNYIEPIKLDKAKQLIHTHHEQGDLLLVITATNRFIAEPIVNQLNIHHILATEPEIRQGYFTGNIVGIPCFQRGKVERLQCWLKEREKEKSKQSLLDHITFYSDSINDEPLLSYVDHAVAVDPDDALRQLAEEKRWPVISLRDDP